MRLGDEMEGSESEGGGEHRLQALVHRNSCKQKWSGHLD